jgi:hypothetical protein
MHIAAAQQIENSQAPETDSQAQALSRQQEHHKHEGWGNSQVAETDSHAQALSKLRDYLELWGLRKSHRRLKQTLRHRP